MTWTVEFTGKAKKQADKLPVKVREVFFQLVIEIETTGPVGVTGPITQSYPTIGTIAT